MRWGPGRAVASWSGSTVSGQPQRHVTALVALLLMNGVPSKGFLHRVVCDDLLGHFTWFRYPVSQEHDQTYRTTPWPGAHSREVQNDIP